MSNREINKARVIRNVIDGKLKWAEAALMLRRTERTIGRLCANVRREVNHSVTMYTTRIENSLRWIVSCLRRCGELRDPLRGYRADTKYAERNYAADCGTIADILLGDGF